MNRTATIHFLRFSLQIVQATFVALLVISIPGCAPFESEPKAGSSPTEGDGGPLLPTDWSQQSYVKAGNVADSDAFGTSVAISGDTMVVGAPGEDSSQTTITNGSAPPLTNGGDDVGAAYVYVRSGSSWVQQAYLIAPNGSDYFSFGKSVAISGNTIVVGSGSESSDTSSITNGATAPTDQDSVASGAAYVFVRSGITWTMQAHLKASNHDAGDYFGMSVAIDGDTIVVGAGNEDGNQTTISNGTPGSADDSLTDSGAVYVYVRSGTNWSEQAYLKAPNAEANDSFGANVDISGDTIVAGAMFEDSSQVGITNGATAAADNLATNSGAAYVFVRSGTTWSQQAYLKASNSEAGDVFGHPRISGNTIVVGSADDSSQRTITNGPSAPSDNLAADSGAVFVFVRSGTTWSQQAYLKAPNADANDFFGTVAIDGDTIVVSAVSEASNLRTITNGPTASSNNDSIDSGAVYIFVRSGSTWSHQSYIKSVNSDDSDYFGSVMAVDGDTVVVGTPSEKSDQSTITNGPTASPNNDLYDAGAVYVYLRE